MAGRKPNDDRYVDNTKGPYPDGDPRNITLTPSDNPIEPPRSGPAEDRYRDDTKREKTKREEPAASANAVEGAKGRAKPVGAADGEAAGRGKPKS